MSYLATGMGLDIDELKLPASALLVYQPEYFAMAKELCSASEVSWWHYPGRMLQGIANGTEFCVALSFVGAPGAVMLLEEMIACGVRRVVEVGMAGAIEPTLGVGEAILVTEAISDEGTSKHYFPDLMFLPKYESSPKLTAETEGALKFAGIHVRKGTVWSIDGVYRETRQKATSLRRRGTWQ